MMQSDERGTLNVYSLCRSVLCRSRTTSERSVAAQ